MKKFWFYLVLATTLFDYIKDIPSKLSIYQILLLRSKLKNIGLTLQLGVYTKSRSLSNIYATNIIIIVLII